MSGFSLRASAICHLRRLPQHGPAAPDFAMPAARNGAWAGSYAL
jgi:hypothetical protein